MMPTYYVQATSKKAVKKRIDELFADLIESKKSACHKNKWITDIGKYEDRPFRYIYNPPKGYEPEDNEVSFHD